jgi:hypothetical protein
MANFSVVAIAALPTAVEVSSTTGDFNVPGVPSVFGSLIPPVVGIPAVCC